MSKARIFGYARVSSTDQNLDRQIELLKKYVPMDYILTDKESGKEKDYKDHSDGNRWK